MKRHRQGFYDSPSGKHARLQLLTIEDLLTGKGIEPPPVQTSTAFKPAPQASPRIGKTAPFGFGKHDPDQPF